MQILYKEGNALDTCVRSRYTQYMSVDITEYKVLFVSKKTPQGIF